MSPRRPLHAAAFDLHDDFAPLVIGFVKIQPAVHAALCPLAFAFLEQTRVNERERPMLELKLVLFRQPLRVGERQRSRMLTVLEFQFCFLNLREALIFSFCKSLIRPSICL